MKFRNRKRALITIVTAVVLVVILVVSTATGVFANNRYLYISDIRMAYAATQEEAEQELIDAGYTPVHQNLRGEADLGETYENVKFSSQYLTSVSNCNYYACIGYKTTTDRDDAITDVKFMNMNGGYDTMDYTALKKSCDTSINKNAKRLQEAVEAMKANVATGSTFALAGRDILDLYYYEEEDGTHTPLSNWLFDDSRTLDDFVTLTMACNTVVINTIYNALTYGCSDLTNSFAGQFSSQIILSSDASASEWSKQDKVNLDKARILSDKIIAFAENYAKVADDCTKTIIDGDDNIIAEDVDLEEQVDTSDVAKQEDIQTEISYNGDISDEYVDAAKDAKKTDDYSSTYEAALDQTESEIEEEESNYAIFAVIYQCLSTVECPASLDGSGYGNPTNLGDYLLGYANAVKDKSSPTKEDYRYLYPLAASLTTAQANIVNIVGIPAFQTWLVDAADAKEVRADVKSALQENLISEVQAISSESDIVDENNRIDIFLGVRDEIYKEKVGITDATRRATDAKMQYDILTAENSDPYLEKIQFWLKVSNIASAVAGVVSGIVGIGFLIGTGSIIGVGTMCSIIWGTCTTVAMTTGACIGAVIGVAATIISVAAIVMMVVCMILLSLYEDELAEKNSRKATYSYIPKRMYDYEAPTGDDEDSYFVEYDAVLTPDGSKVADVNGYCSIDQYSQWVVMYVSKDQAVSSPIVVEKKADACPFAFSEANTIPENYRAVSTFGQLTASDLRCYHNFRFAFREGTTPIQNLYAFFQTENSVKGESDGPLYEEGKYFSTMKISTEDTQDAAKDALIFSGYTIIDRNLSQNSDKFSYLGYKTTNNVKYAVRDIRVAAETYSDSGRKFGTQSYSCAGYTGNYVGLYTTSYDTAGFPITVSSLKLVTDKSQITEDEIEVNQFSGGDAYDFTLYRGNKTYGSEGLYMCFSYEDGYEIKNKEEIYLDGIAFFALDMSGDDATAYIQSQGYEVVAIENGSSTISSNSFDLTDNTTDRVETYIAISRTNNPYRAITDIHTHEAATTDLECAVETGDDEMDEMVYWGNVSQMMPTITLGSETYAVCETFQKYKSEEYVRKQHSYTTEAENSDCSGNFEEYSYARRVPLHTVYVDGPTTTKDEKTGELVANPLKVTDLYFSTSKTAKEGYKPVVSFIDQYAETATNLTFEGRKTYNSHLYMFLKGTAPTRGKYVKSVYVGTYYKSTDSSANENSNYFGDETAILNALASAGECKFMRINLAASKHVDNEDGRYYGTATYSYDANNGLQEYAESCTGYCAYMAVSYTDNANEAIKYLQIKNFDSLDKADKCYSYNDGGAVFTKCGGSIQYSGCSKAWGIYSSDNDYYGDPITDVFVDLYPYTNEHIAILSTDNYTEKELTGSNVYDCAYFPSYTKADSGEYNYYVRNVKLAWGEYDVSARRSLVNAGCDYIVPVDKNWGLGGDYVYVGYSRTTDENAEDLVTGIQSLAFDDSPGNFNDTTIDGLTYSYVSTHDMNSGRGGDYTYLLTSTDKKANPISDLFVYYAKCGSNSSTINESASYPYSKHTNDLSGDRKNVIQIGYAPTDWYKYSKGKLTIKCYGEMPTFTDSWQAPWLKYAAKITTVEIKSGVSSLNEDTLTGLTALTKVQFDHTSNDKINIKKGSVPAGCTIYGYKNTPVWAYYLKYRDIYNYKFIFLDSSQTVDNVTASLNSKLEDESYEDNTLTLSGSGELTGSVDSVIYSLFAASGMSDIDKYDYITTNITTLIIKGSFTKVDDDYFADLLALTDIYIYDDAYPISVLNNFPYPADMNYYAHLNTTVSDFCVENGYTFNYIVDQTNTADNPKEKWDISGDTLIIKTGAKTLKDAETDNCHSNTVKYDIDASKIKHVLVKSTVQYLPLNAFDGYSNLEDIKFVSDYITQKEATSKLLTIPANCFRNCSKLKAFSIPSTVTTINANAFEGCKNFGDITVSAKVSTIGSGAFLNCGDGFKVTIKSATCNLPEKSAVVSTNGTIVCAKNSAAYASARLNFETTASISSSADAKCLWEFESGGVLTISNDGAVPENNWNNLSKYVIYIDIDEGVTSLPASAFKGFTKLESVTTPSTLKEIPESMCQDVTSLKTLNLTEGIETISANAFNGCSALDLVGDVNYRKQDAIAYLFPEGLKNIGDCAFKGIYDPESTKCGLYLPTTIETIGVNAIDWMNGFVSLYSTDAELADDAILTTEFHQMFNSTSDAVNKLTNVTDFKFITGWSYKDNKLSLTGSWVTSFDSFVIPDYTPWSEYINDIKSIYICGPTIEAGAFKDYKRLESVTIGSSFGIGSQDMQIPNNAFSGCSKLKSVTIENTANITSIGNEAFYGCSVLSDTGTMLDTVTSIGDSAFYNCVNLKGDSKALSCLYKIGESAFYGCSALSTVSPTTAFNSYSNEISARAFCGCYNLTLESTFFNNVTTIGEYAFKGCSKLFGEYFAFPDSVTTVRSHAFDFDTDATVFLPKTMTNIESNAFTSTDSTMVINAESQSDINDIAVTGATIIGPDWVKSYVAKLNSRNKSIANINGSTYKEITYATCPTWTYASGVLTLTGSGNMYSFPNKETAPWNQYADSITTVNVGDGITSIGSYYFAGMTSLKSVSLPTSLTKIAKNAFAGDTSLTALTINAEELTSCKSIFGSGNNAQATITCLADTTTYNTLTAEGYKVSASKEPRYSYEGKVLTIEYCDSDSALSFSSDTVVEEVIFSDKITSIPDSIFKGCTSLKKVTLPENITAIPNYMCYNCTALETVNIPSTVKTIGNYAFCSCTSLKLFSDENCPNGYYLFNEGLTSIGKSAFMYVPFSSIDISFPTTLKTIGDGAFYSTSKPAAYILNSADTTVASTGTLIASDVYFPYGSKSEFKFSSNCTTHEINSWTVDRNVLYITGGYEDFETSGMFNYRDAGERPWNDYAADITAVVFEYGMSSIGDYALADLTNCTSVTFNNEDLGNMRITSIGKNVFSGMTGIKSIELPTTVVKVDDQMCGTDKTAITFVAKSGTTTYTALTNGSFKVSTSSVLSSAFTGEYNVYLLIALASVLVITAVVFVVLNRKKKAKQKN